MKLSADSMARVVAFLPYFQDETMEKVVFSPDAVAGPYVYAEEVQRFVLALYEEGIVYDFDWQGWRETAITYLSDRSLIESADLETICKLVTTIARAEKNTNGILGEMINKGVITDILKRLQELKVGLKLEC